MARKDGVMFQVIMYSPPLTVQNVQLVKKQPLDLLEEKLKILIE